MVAPGAWLLWEKKTSCLQQFQWGSTSGVLFILLLQLSQFQKRRQSEAVTLWFFSDLEPPLSVPIRIRTATDFIFRRLLRPRCCRRSKQIRQRERGGGRETRIAPGVAQWLRCNTADASIEGVPISQPYIYRGEKTLPANQSEKKERESPITLISIKGRFFEDTL